MKRSLAVLAVAGLAVAVTVALPASAGTRARTAKLHKTTTFIQLTDIAFSDADGSGGNSPGDILAFGLTEFNKEGGKQIGKGHGYCVLTVEPYSTCTSVVTDDNGALVVVADNKGTSATNPFAITGGTGRYARASGHGKLIAKGGDPNATSYTVKSRIYY